MIIAIIQTFKRRDHKQKERWVFMLIFGNFAHKNTDNTQTPRMKSKIKKEVSQYMYIHLITVIRPKNGRQKKKNNQFYKKKKSKKWNKKNNVHSKSIQKYFVTIDQYKKLQENKNKQELNKSWDFDFLFQFENQRKLK